jgi:hypothetical protein
MRGESFARTKILRLALFAATLGILFSLALLLKETPYTLVGFMFLGQPLLALALLLLAVEVVRDLRARGVL